MIYKRYESDSYSKNGIYYYAKDDKSSSGIGLKLGKRLWMIRISKLTGKLHFWSLKAN